jgi:acyl-CoA thioester hydrolase
VPHQVSYRVYYEDTDCLGVVYYANYFKFLERGRTEFVGATGKDVAAWNREGVGFVVYSVNAKFKRPAVLGDTLDVLTEVRIDSEYRCTFVQRILRGGEVLVTADVEIVCIDRDQKLCPVPESFRALVQA